VTLLGDEIELIERLRPQEVAGSVHAVRGLSVLVDDLPMPVGTLVRLHERGSARQGRPIARGEIVGFSGEHSIVMLFDHPEGIGPDAVVVADQPEQTVAVGASLLGRVLNGFAAPIDGRPVPRDTRRRSLRVPPLGALRRRPITEPLPTGVRAIDALTTIGRGQRVGIFSGPGVGKSTLLAMIARGTSADVSVIGLIGERGREVRDFLDHALGSEGLKRSVVIVSTGDESPLLRLRASLAACAIAEHFRDQGADVMLLIDSITRLAQAQRQVGLAAGEQPATKGYPPSVFAMLPALLERAGSIEGGGSITGFYNVLVEGDDLTEPIADAARGVLDGHIALSRRLAARGHFPAIDTLQSVSRVADAVCDQHHIAARRRIVRLLAAYAEAEELINIGAYARGSNPDCDVAISLKPRLDQFLAQDAGLVSGYPQTCRALIDLAAEAELDAKRRASLPPPARTPAAAEERRRAGARS
jgi:flagellum-specific ATP synthase